MSFALSFQYEPQPSLTPFRGDRASMGHLAIVFDGHLHNRNELLDASHTAAPSDAGIALRAWIAAPDRFPHDLTGEFALAIFDARERTLLCARDHTGLRPFYWFDDGNAIHCASDIDWFFTLPAFRARANEAFAAEWLANEIRSRVDTLYDGVRRLPAATTMLVTGSGPSTPRRYWLPDFDRPHFRGSDDEYASAFRDVFAEAVRCRAGSHAAVELSGGVDSTSVAGVAHAIGNPLDTYSLVFDEPESDERDYIAAATTMFGTRSHLFAPTEHDSSSFRAQAKELRRPPTIPNGYMSAELVRAAQANGITTLLTGVGGDDWFEGLPTIYRTADLLAGGRVLEAIRTAGMASSVRATRAIAGRALRRSAPYVARVLAALRRNGDQLPPWIIRSFAQRVHLAERLATPSANARGFVAAAMEGRLHHGWQTFAIESEWAAAQRVGIELTHPFYDRRVVEFAATLPEEQRFRDGTTKVVLRNAVRGLIPEMVRTRTTKAYFNHLLPRAFDRIDAPSFMRNMRLSELGWIDEARLREGYEEMQRLRSREQYMHLGWPIWMAVSLEAWARANL